MLNAEKFQNFHFQDHFCDFLSKMKISKFLGIQLKYDARIMGQAFI